MSASSIAVAPPDSESRVTDYLALLKPGVMSLVVFSGVTGILLAPGEIHPFIAFIATLCIAMGSGASGAVNMWIERDIDAHMRRTQNRPLPAGRIAPAQAIEFAVVMAASAVFIMAVAVNFLAAALLLSAILFYIFIYTLWLKPNTPQNIVIGGAAGAFPPVIGWAAVTGSVSIEPLILFAIIFMWTPPHFWALALYRSDDYAKVGIPMLPVVRGQHETKKYIVAYTLLLVPLTLAPVAIGMSGWFYGVGALALGLKFLYGTLKVYHSEEPKEAMRLFGYSILYLFMLFSVMIIDKWLVL